MDLAAFLQRNFLPLTYLLLVIGLALRPTIWRITATFPLMVLLIIQPFRSREKGYFGDDYPSGNQMMTLVFTYIDWILLGNPDREQWHKVGAGGKPVEQYSDFRHIRVPSSFRQRLWWSSRLILYLRGVGWSHQAKNVPEALPADYSKWKFVARKLLRAMFFFFYQDAIAAYTASTPYGCYRGMKFEPKGFMSEPFQTQILFVWLHIGITYSTLEMINCIISAVAVILGLTTPKECPPLFGDICEMYTVRRSWSITWHQCMRRHFVCINNLLARDLLALRKGQFVSKYFQLFMGFFISAIIHGCSSAAYTGAIGDGYADLKFFMLQPLAILIEDHVIYLGKLLGFTDGPLWTALGYAWSVAWFSYSTREWTSSAVAKGVWQHKHAVDPFALGPAEL